MTSQKTDHDVLILGGGPAGMAAAMWCSELGLEGILVERGPELGGQLNMIYNPIKNYPGLETADGKDLCERFRRSLASRTFELRLSAEVKKADLAARSFDLADGDQYSANSILIATGVRRRKLGIPGEAEFHGRGILESGARSRNAVAGKRVLIVGGGDAAFENALMLSETAEQVILVHRRAEFTAREEFVESVRARSNVKILTNCRLTEITGNTSVTAASIEEITSGSPHLVDVDAVLIRIGVQPNSELFRGQLETDTDGYITIDSLCRTSVEGVYSIGDVANPVSPTISTAAGMAAVAVKAIKSAA
jgi:thioredoxin reductase (NADPH)